MSFWSDLTSGNFGNLGQDLAPSNIFSDTVKDTGGAYTIPELIGGAGLALGGLGLAGGLGGLGAGLGAGAAGAGAPLDILAGGTAGGTAGLDTIGTLGGIGTTSGLGAGLSTEPAFAGSVGADALSGFGAVDTGAGALPFGATLDTGQVASPLSPASNAQPLTTPWSQGGVGPTGGPPPVGGVPGTAGVGGSATPAGAGPLDLTSGATTPGSLDSLATGIQPGAATPSGSAPTAAGATAPTAAGATTPQSLTSQLGQFFNPTTASGLVHDVSAGALGYQLYSQNQTQNAQTSAIKQQQAAANAQAQAANAAAQPILQQGQLLTQYLQTGTLPAPMQAQLNQAVAAAKAQAYANAGAQGLSVDPATNSALAQQLASIDQNAQVTRANQEQTLQTAGTQMIQQANALISTGLNATQMSAQLQEYLTQLDAETSAATGKAIANFAASLAPPGGQKFQLTPAAA